MAQDITTVKINELATSAINSSDYFVKADQNGIAYKNTLSALANFIGSVGVLGFKGALEIADTPTEDGFYFASESGTYTNAGGLVVDLNAGINIISVEEGQTVFELVVIPVDLSGQLVQNIEGGDTTHAPSADGVFRFGVEEAVKSNWLRQVDGDLTDLEVRSIRVIEDIVIDDTSINDNIAGGVWFLAALTRNNSTLGDRIIIRVIGLDDNVYDFSSINPSGTFSDVDNVYINSLYGTILVSLNFNHFIGSETLMINTGSNPKLLLKNSIEKRRAKSEVNSFNLIASKSTGNDYIKIEDGVLKFKNIIFHRGEGKLVYINDLVNPSQDGANATNEIDLSALNNASYLYIDLDDFNNAPSTGNINLKWASTWITYIPKNRYVVAYLQTIGDESSYKGDLIDLYRNEKLSKIVTPSELNLDSFSNYRYKTASIDNGNNESLVIALHGDSWTQKIEEFSRYTTFVARHLRQKYGDGGGGFYDFSASEGGQFMRSIDEDDANDTRTGTIDYIDEGANALGINCAHPVFQTGAGLTLNVTSPHEKFVIHYYGGAGMGVFRYRVDSGAWVEVDTSLTEGYTTIDVGVLDAVHVLEFECVSGACVILGVDMQREFGVRVHKFGNRGLRASDVVEVDHENWKAAIAAFNIDSFTTLLGTNDRTSNVTLQNFKERMDIIYNLVVQANPYIDFCFISPSNNLEPANVDMEHYAKQLYDLALQYDCAYISLIPIFGSPNKIQSKAFFFDNVHPTIEGGRSISNFITNKLLN